MDKPDEGREAIEQKDELLGAARRALGKAISASGSTTLNADVLACFAKELVLLIEERAATRASGACLSMWEIDAAMRRRG